VFGMAHGRGCSSPPWNIKDAIECDSCYSIAATAIANYSEFKIASQARTPILEFS
jgi:hypothetical protein